MCIRDSTYTDTVDNPESKEFAASFRAKYKYAPDLFADYGYVGAKTIGEALKMTGGDASDKDKLAEAMAKVKFNAPRGPFRMDPATHNPIQDIYICQVIESGEGISTKTLFTAKDVQDPGKKDVYKRQRQRCSRHDEDRQGRLGPSQGAAAGQRRAVRSRDR